MRRLYSYGISQGTLIEIDGNQGLGPNQKIIKNEEDFDELKFMQNKTEFTARFYKGNSPSGSNPELDNFIRGIIQKRCNPFLRDFQLIMNNIMNKLSMDMEILKPLKDRNFIRNLKSNKRNMNPPPQQSQNRYSPFQQNYSASKPEPKFKDIETIYYVPNIAKIINKYQNRKEINAHFVNPCYLKLTEAEENKMKEEV